MSYKRGIPYVWPGYLDDNDPNEDNRIIHFWGEHDDSCKDTVWYGNYRDSGIPLGGIQMTMKDFDQIVIQRLIEIIKYEHTTDKYKKIEKMFNESKKFRG